MIGLLAGNGCVGASRRSDIPEQFQQKQTAQQAHGVRHPFELGRIWESIDHFRDIGVNVESAIIARPCGLDAFGQTNLDIIQELLERPLQEAQALQQGIIVCYGDDEPVDRAAECPGKRELTASTEWVLVVSSGWKRLHDVQVAACQGLSMPSDWSQEYSVLDIPVRTASADRSSPFGESAIFFAPVAFVDRSGRWHLSQLNRSLSDSWTDTPDCRELGEWLEHADVYVGTWLTSGHGIESLVSEPHLRASFGEVEEEGWQTVVTLTAP
jgi:hypothetical protein